MTPAAEATALPWRFGLSSTLKGIYVIRYVLFSGGLAIAFALVDRVTLHSQPPLVALGLGLLVGLACFRGQLRPLSWPVLSLSRDALYLIQKKRAVTLPWSNVRAVVAEGPAVTLRLATAMTSPTGEIVEAVQLEAKKLGTSAPLLAQTLSPLVESPAARNGLPTDARLKVLLQLP